MMFFGLTAKAQTTITFDTEDYKSVGVYDKWEESPFRTGELEGNAGIALNPSTTPDEVLGVAPNTTEKVVAFQRSRYGSNVYGVRIDLKEPIRVTKQLQYVHVMTYLKDKPTASRMMVIGLGRRLEESWSGQAGQDVEQFWSYTTTNVEPKDGWQDIVVSFKGFSYSVEENENSGIDLHALVIVPDVRTPDEDAADWVAYFDEIVVDGNPDKRFSTEQYALTYDKEAAMNRTDRALNKVGLTVGDKTYESAARSQKFYSNNTTTSVFSAKAGDQVQPTFGYSGNWMSGYVYVDWGNDALFKDALNANGTPAEGSDVVSYNAVQIGETWYKSDGTTRGDGNAIAQGVPQFTVPEGTANGFYRMRYKVDWNSINPAGATDIIANGGGIVDLMLDVHGDKVTVNASQLNGDIYAADGTDLISYVAGYEQPLKVKVVPAPGFVQYGFTLKYGYDVSAKEQLDDKGNPSWIEVNVPYTEIAGDGTYTIPAEYMRGSQVSITGDMQQEQLYTVEVVGLEGQGGVVYANIETLHGGTVYATQFFTVEQVEAIAVEGYTGEVSLEERTIRVVYTADGNVEEAPVVVTSILENKLYTLECRSGAAHSAARFIGITEEGKISGQSTTAAFIKFEKANDANGYYIKIVDAEKYLNYDGSNIVAEATKSTVWTLGVGGKDNVADVVTFTIGDNKYLNNNASADKPCPHLQANTHADGPGEGNACSLWEMTQYPEPEEVLAFVEPVAGKFYKLMGDNEAGMPWLTNQLSGNSIVVSADKADAAIFEKTENGLKDVVTGKYLGMNGSFVSLVDNETNVVIGEHNDNNATGNGVKYSVKVGTNYMYNNNSDGKTHESSDWLTTIERYWGFIEVEKPGAAEEALLAYWKTSILPNLGYVGGYSADLLDEIEAVETLDEKEAFEAEHKVLAINAATYYRLVCVAPKTDNNGDTSYNTLTFDGQGNLVTRPTVEKDWNQLFRFEDAGEGKYYLRNINANAYLNKISAGGYRSAVVAENDACKVEVLSCEGTGIQWRFHNSESDNAKHCLFAENHPSENVPYACSGWEAGANSASAWHIVPVTDFAHTLTMSDVNWASLMLGFETAIPAEVSAYVVSSVEDGCAQLTEVEGVLPANTAVLINAEAGNYEFAYSAATPATVAANELKGTLYNKNVEGAAYALGVKEGNVALYTVNLDQAEGTAFINYAYKAYLPKKTAEASVSLRIEGTTGIENSEISNQNSPFIYDLMGRRVEKMVKGVYIVNGRKVIK